MLELVEFNRLEKKNNTMGGGFVSFVNGYANLM
jgi:hypothetical protein